MKRAVIIAAGTAVLALTGCSDWDDWEYTPASGIIIELEHEPAEDYQDCGYEYTYDPVTGQYKNVHSCDWVYEDECYEVEFKTPEGNVVEDCTTEAMFAQLDVGMSYTQGQTSLTVSPSPSPSSTG